VTTIHTIDDLMAEFDRVIQQTAIKILDEEIGYCFMRAMMSRPSNDKNQALKGVIRAYNPTMADFKAIYEIMKKGSLKGVI